MIDRERMIEMMDGDAALAEKLIRSFKEQVSRQLPLMRKYLDEGNTAMLSNSAHIMKTQVSYLGLEDVAALAQQLEEKAEHQEMDSAARLFSELEAKVTHLIQIELK